MTPSTVLAAAPAVVAVRVPAEKVAAKFEACATRTCLISGWVFAVFKTVTQEPPRQSPSAVHVAPSLSPPAEYARSYLHWVLPLPTHLFWNARLEARVLTAPVMVLQKPLMQSLLDTQFLLAAHDGQLGPPQFKADSSTSVADDDKHWAQALVGVAVGALVGASVGVVVGNLVGASVGEGVGAGVGETVGSSVSPVVVGSLVGAFVGACVGASVGVAVGLEVGADVTL
jgi:hypothetical protein